MLFKMHDAIHLISKTLFNIIHVIACFLTPFLYTSGFVMFRVVQSEISQMKWALMKNFRNCLNGILNSIWSRIQIKGFCFQKSFHIFFVAYFSQVLSDTFWETSENN